MVDLDRFRNFRNFSIESLEILKEDLKSVKR